MRWQAFEAGANMVTHCRHALLTALQQVEHQQLELQLPVHQDAGENQQAALAQTTGHGSNRAASIGVPNEQHPQQEVVCCTCDWCGLPGLSAAEYWQHQQLYHINHPNRSGNCQICGR